MPSSKGASDALAVVAETVRYAVFAMLTETPPRRPPPSAASRPSLAPFLVLATLLGAPGCKGDPDPKPGAGGGDGVPGCPADESIEVTDGEGCAPDADDYQPRDDGSANDTWPACISDDGVYHPIESNISTNARVAAFEQMATRLGFGTGAAPAPQAFIDARVAYTEPEGLDSRVSRREDEHYPPAPASCRDLSADELASHPERCVGPARMQPLLNEALAAGAQGEEPALNAARVEAALLWFFYVSAYKEAVTCKDTAKDCDSSSAYYAGTQARSPAFGFARYVEARSPQAHAATWDAILAVRCWRDLDNPGGTAMDDALHGRALAQLDRALDRGLALIVRQRLSTLPCDTAWESLKILGPALDRAATARDPGQAAILRDELSASSSAEVDVATATAALDALFPCP